MKGYIIAFVCGFVFAGLLVGGYELYKYKTEKPGISIGETKEGEHGLKPSPKPIPKDPTAQQKADVKFWTEQADRWKQLYFFSVNSEIMITPMPRGMWLDIRAEDGYKFAEMSYKIVCPSVFHRNLIIITPMIFVGIPQALNKLDFAAGLSLSYIRMLSPYFGVGAGLVYIHHFVVKETYYGAQVSGVISF